MAELLVRHGASVNVADLWKFTPLHEAAAKGKYEICKLLLKVSICHRHHHSLTWSLAVTRNPHTLLCSMEQIQLRRTGMATFHWTWWKTVTRTSRTSCEVTPPSLMLPRRAVWLGCRSFAPRRTSTAETHKGATPRHYIWQVRQALFYSRFKFVCFVFCKLEHYCQIEECVDTGVWCCSSFIAGYNNLEVAEYLLEHGADVNAQDKGGLIPLHNAASYGVS